jgi:hypothetical protein
VGRLENNIVARVARVELAAGFAAQIITNVLGFPEAVRKAEVVEQGSIHPERMPARTADFPFGNQMPIMLPGAVVQEILEGGADGRFMPDTQLLKLTQRRAIVLNGLVRRLEFQRCHGVGPFFPIVMLLRLTQSRKPWQVIGVDARLAALRERADRAMMKQNLPAAATSLENGRLCRYVIRS